MLYRYFGMALAIVSNSIIGASFIIIKKGLKDTSQYHSLRGQASRHLKTPTWWIGFAALAIGELGNFAAYAFAPAILVTPFGAVSVLTGAILGRYFLNETLGILGKIGVFICLLGTTQIVFHAPPNEDIRSIEQISQHAVQLGYLIYMGVVITFSIVMIRSVAPTYGKSYPLVYISVCSAVGSIAIVAIKAFGIALKLTLAGDDQFSHLSTYGFMVFMLVCVIIQLYYFNKTLALFPLSIVNPLYYISFTTATLLSSSILFGGLTTVGIVNTLSSICGLLLIFAGVFLLQTENARPSMEQHISSAVSMDTVNLYGSDSGL
ncbi:magnesium transporter [Fusarium oxysporum]|nr:magnesium transporter [Fusarium oxysporum]